MMFSLDNPCKVVPTVSGVAKTLDDLLLLLLIGDRAGEHPGVGPGAGGEH